EKKQKDKDDAHVVDKGDKRARLWLLTLAASDAKALTDPKWAIQELIWHPSDSGLMLSATDHPESDQNTHRLVFFPLADSSLTQALAPRGPFGHIRGAPDGQRMAFLGSREDGPVPHDLMIAKHSDKSVGNLTGASLDRLVTDFAWAKDNSLLLI